MKDLPEPTASTPKTRGLLCRLVVRGTIGMAWEDWLQEVQVQPTAADLSYLTIVTGRCIDRSALFGLLAALRDSNVDLISFEQMLKEQTT